jgi:hypothetical protein
MPASEPRLVAGKTYRVTLTISSLVSGSLSLLCFGGVTQSASVTSPGVTTLTLNVDSGGAGVVYLRCVSAVSSAVIDSISIKEILGNHATQSTSTARPKLSARVNLLTGTATLSTQSFTVAAGSHTIFWTGAGTVTASGAYSGALTSGQTFTTTAGTLTLTVAGSVTSAQLNTGSTALRYQSVTDASNYDYSGFPLIHQFDGVDDAHVITFASSLGTDCTVVTANRGTTPTIATGQTIGTSYTITATNAGRLVFPRALTAAETAIVTKWATQKGALP